MKRITLNLLSALCVLLAFTSCHKPTPQELFEKQQSGVCMVLNTYYYEITMPNGEKFYCSGIDEDGDLENFSKDENEVLEKKNMVTGTGFFIDDKGTIMTNRHVVSPEVSEETIRKSTNHLLKQLKGVLKEIQRDFNDQFNSLEAEKSSCYGFDLWGDWTVDNARLAQIEEKQRELANNYREAEEMIENLNDIDASDINVKPISEIGIAFNNTHVTKEADFLGQNPCVVTKVSDIDDVDLATIQLKNKTTPADKYIFKIKGRDDNNESFIDKILNFFSSNNDELDVNQELMMIGYNAGLILGSTPQGIQAQMTTGKISQKPDGSKILYSIPTLQGSSGSPVIDMDGYVRAVNFAKLRGTDTFNFGIPENKILSFLN